MSIIPVTVPTGAIRYNTDSNKMECFNGTKWMQVSVSSPDLDGSQPNGGGRAIVVGGTTQADDGNGHKIRYVNIKTTGDGIDFGSLNNFYSYPAGASSSTRGIIAGGSAPGTTYIDVIQYVTIASTGNPIDFGDLTTATWGMGGVSNETRAVFAGGKVSPGAEVNTIEYITMASLGDAKDFGDLTVIRNNVGPFGNPTRGLFAGGYDSPNNYNIIDYVTIASTGNAQDFGDMSGSSMTGQQHQNTGSSTRGLIWSTAVSPYVTIESLQYATKGNSIDFGDSSQAIGYRSCTSDCIRGVGVGGQSGPGDRNCIEYLTIATGGNAVDFGDTAETHHRAAAFSNAHGGL